MKHYLIGLILLITFGLGFLFIAKDQLPKEQVSQPQAQTYEYFWGDGCPHCANVDTFLSSWDKSGTINIKKMEVWKDKTNAAILQQRATSCGIPDDRVGVPFLYTPGGQCISGDQPIISFFKGLGS